MARTRGRRPRGSTQTPVRDATWREGGWPVKGPRVSGPWLEYWGGNAIALNRPAIYMHVSLLFLLCGTMFLHNFFCRRHGGITSVGSDHKALIAWTRVNQRTCAKPDISEIDLPLTWRRVDALGASDLHQTDDSEGTT